MDLSTIIVSYNTKDLLSKCLHSLFEKSDLNSFSSEVIVVDNSSSDNSAKMVKMEFPQVELIKNSQNQGFAKANNQGLKMAQGDYLFLLNPDTQMVQADFFASMMQDIRANPKIGLLGPRLLNRDGTLQLSARYFPNPLTHFLEINGWVPHLKKLNSQKGPVDWVSGAAMFIRRKAIEETGLFDEGYFMYIEEMDLQYRMRQKGWEVWYYPKVELVHLGGKSTEQIKEQGLIWQLNNFTKFTQKHYGKISRILLKVVTACGLLLMMLKSQGDQKGVYRRVLKKL